MPDKQIHAIDEGCATLLDLINRCDHYNEIYGPGTITKHPRGLLYESEGEHRILIVLQDEKP